jgi:hypothetical protein
MARHFAGQAGQQGSRRQAREEESTADSGAEEGQTMSKSDPFDLTDSLPAKAAPAPAGSTIIACPACAQLLTVPASIIGKDAKCPMCGASFAIPLARHAAPPVPRAKAACATSLGPICAAKPAAPPQHDPSIDVSFELWRPASSAAPPVEPSSAAPAANYDPDAPPVEPAAGPLRFTCPTCATLHTVPASCAGDRMLCPKCGQKLRVPLPPRPTSQNRTVLGKLVEPAPAGKAPFPSPDAEPLELPGRPRVFDEDRPRRKRADNGTDYGSMSLTCGILALVACGPLLGPLAVTFGIIALARRREPGADLSAVFGIILGILAVIVSAFLFLVYFEQELRRQGMRHF